MSAPRAGLHFATLASASKAIRERDISVSELVRGQLERIQELNPLLNAFVTIVGDATMERARELDQMLVRGEYLGPLHGLPVAIKDNLVTAGIRTTAGSRILRDWIPDDDATVVQRLKQAGAIVIGKANLYEFAFASFHDDYGECHNPWDTTRCCGSSSSGSAAAVSAGLVFASIGSDHGGSVRLPAALCGVVGLKPTSGLVSRAGIVPAMYSLDHLGPLARTVEDVAIVLQAIAGADPHDPLTASTTPSVFTEALDAGVRGLRIGIPTWHDADPIDPEMRAAHVQAIAVLEGLGGKTQPLAFPEYKLLQDVSRAIGLPEISESHRQWADEHRDDYSPTVGRFLRMGEFLPATAYVHALKIRERLIQRYEDLMREVDVVLMPTIPFPAWTIGSSTVLVNGERLGVLDYQNLYTPVFNVTGQPAIAVPAGFSKTGLPLSIQIAAARHGDAVVLRVARAYEEATSWHDHHPNL